MFSMGTMYVLHLCCLCSLLLAYTMHSGCVVLIPLYVVSMVQWVYHLCNKGQGLGLLSEWESLAFGPRSVSVPNAIGNANHSRSHWGGDTPTGAAWVPSPALLWLTAPEMVILDILKKFRYNPQLLSQRVILLFILIYIYTPAYIERY